MPTVIYVTMKDNTEICMLNMQETIALGEFEWNYRRNFHQVTKLPMSKLLRFCYDTKLPVFFYHLSEDVFQKVKWEYDTAYGPKEQDPFRPEDVEDQDH